ncbi:Formyltransferase/hydrolase complex Fhc subunit B [Caulifigura coniformis]|uniref:Formyltransferase/hydrolase complex Fhc subunit B n=1 Tax=Caulifigura coniformis TaxID=2527983 RepID=A0A517SMM6_9PLAN|nr:formylmethanofuran dehydrogenase subunit B [Caulifigura coniformis]QDT57384.1 Formyltransferase/hydrolase complex Fhc subunit B [Caulifigura coniformis]
MQTFHDVACTVCGCVCDDLTLTFDGDRLTGDERACELARPWLYSLNEARPPVARLQGAEATLEKAIGEAATLLKGSRAPLIYGLSRSSTPGQRAAVSLADQIGAIIDTTASKGHGPSIMAIQEIGESTSTLGEVARRSDLVIFWGADPAQTHPRHFERYSIEPTSDLLPHGKEDRHVIVIDVHKTQTAAVADEVILVQEGRDFEMIAALRMLVRDPDCSPVVDCGVPLEQLRSLAKRMTECRYGAVFFGLGIASLHLGHLAVEALLELTADLNEKTRFIARRLRVSGDVSGADSVLCWQTGFPFGVDLSRGVPRFNPGEFTTEDLLERGEIDACLLVGSWNLPHLSKKALAFLQTLPLIVLDPPNALPPLVAPAVQFTTAVYGIHAPGTAYRMDEVPIPLRKLVDSPYPTDDDVLHAIAANLKGMADATA